MFDECVINNGNLFPLYVQFSVLILEEKSSPQNSAPTTVNILAVNLRKLPENTKGEQVLYGRRKDNHWCHCHRCFGGSVQITRQRQPSDSGGVDINLYLFLLYNFCVFLSFKGKKCVGVIKQK